VDLISYKMLKFFLCSFRWDVPQEKGKKNMYCGVGDWKGRGAEGRGWAATDVGANLRTTKIKWQQENKSLFAQTDGRRPRGVKEASRSGRGTGRQTQSQRM